MMKKLVIIFLTCLWLVACYDVNEEILIRENGSGHYTSKIDMSGLLEMMQNFSSEADLAKEGLDRPMDTVIMLRTMIDSMKPLSADEKAIMETGKMHMIMNLKDKQFTIDMDFDFRNDHDLEFLLAGMGNGGFGDVLKNVFQKDKPAEAQLDAPKDLDVDQFSNMYDVKVQKGSISKKINRAKLDSMLQRPEMAQLNQMGATGMEILYTTTIVLPRPLKSVSNSGIKVSEDKKRLTIKNNLMEVFEKPELFEYVIEY
jgi:hypothetical protein